jgi:Zinc knuckle
MTFTIGCFRCSGTDHWADNCPELHQPPAKDRAEHMARIDKYVEWCNGSLPLPGRITPHQKRQLIENENKTWRDKCAQERKSA